MEIVIHKEDYVVLTLDQVELLKLVAEGKTVKDISREINEPPRTIDHRLVRIRKKMQCKNVAHLIATLFREGVLK